MALAVVVTPGRQLVVRLAEGHVGHAADPVGERDAECQLPADVAARITGAFRESTGAGLLQLGAGEPATPLPAALGFWRDFAARYIAAVCARGEDAESPIADPDEASLAMLAAAAPPIPGGEYIDATLLAEHWAMLDRALTAAVHGSGDSVARFLEARHAAWHLSAACTSTSPRTAATRRLRSRSWPRTRRG